MLLFENIQLALNGLRANKMRALLTMLGIIIGIGSVIAIMTVAGSMTNSITTSMQSMGANNITVSLTQKSDSDYTEGAQTRMFRPTTPGAEDLLTDEMLADYRALYGGSIYAVSLTQSLGSYTVSTNADEAGVNATGVNTEYAAANSVELSRGRFFTEEDEEKARTVAVVSDVFAETLFPGQEAIGQAFQLTYGTKVYTFYIVGVYPYESNGLVLESIDATPTTDMYLPISTAKAMSHADDGYQSFTVVAATGVDTSAFLTQTENFFAGYYTRNTSYTATASSMESLMESMTEMLSTISLAIAVIAGISLLVGGHRRNEYHAGVHHRAHTGDRHPQGAGRDERQHPCAVHRGIRHHLPHRGRSGDSGGPGPGRRGREPAGLCGRAQRGRYFHCGGVLHGHRRVLRLLSGEQSGPAGPH